MLNTFLCYHMQVLYFLKIVQFLAHLVVSNVLWCWLNGLHAEAIRVSTFVF